MSDPALPGLETLPELGDPTYLDAVGAASPAFAQALALHRMDQLSRARSLYLEIIDQPGLAPVCLHQLGILAGQMGDHARAAELIGRAIRLDPDRTVFHQNLVVSLEKLGRIPAALDALIDLGCLHQRVEHHAEAVPVYQRILAVDPLRYGAYVNLGTAYAWLNRPAEAVRFLLAGLVLHAPLLPELAAFLDWLLPRLAVHGFEVPAAVRAGAATGRIEIVEQALTTFGKALMELGLSEESLASYELSAKVAPGLALAHWNLALALLARGQFERGWREYEWRWQWDRFPEPHRQLPAPLWRGEELSGRTILVHAEQGYGDTMQFAPLATVLAEKGARVIFEVTTRLVRLCRQSLESPMLSVIERTSNPHFVATGERLDHVVPLLSLPERLGLRKEQLPLAMNYLRETPEDRARFAELLQPLGEGLRVGLVWAGRPEHADDHKRSVTLDLLRPLFDLRGVHWVSLLVGGQAAQLEASGLAILDLSAHQESFADTAAAIAELDLVISVDTAVAHLAAAMGKPVWILLASVPDWRWGQGGSDTPWYPSARLFRQRRPDDWQAVIADVRGELAARAGAEDGPKPLRRSRKKAGA